MKMYRFENVPMPEGPPTVAIVRKERVRDVIVTMTYDASLLALKPVASWAETLENEWALRVGEAA